MSLLSPFQWLRNAARNAILSGVGDALVEVAGPDTAQPPLTLADLQHRLALPAPEPEEEPSNKRAKK